MSISWKRTSRTRAVAFVVAAAVAAGIAGAAGAAEDRSIGEPPACDDTTVASLSIVDCVQLEAVPSLDGSEPETAAAAAAFAASAGVVQELPAYCRLAAQVVFYTATDWIRLAEAMATDASPCAEYHFSIPALAADKTELRGPLQPELIRALGPRFHAMAEIHFAGWTTWVTSSPTRTWCDAGVEARRRMVDKNFRVELGDTWSINEFTTAVRRGEGNARANVREFVRCLYDGGDGSLPAARGNVFVIGLGQGTTPTTVYKSVLRGWLADTPFWDQMAQSVRFWGQEAYGSPQSTLVPGTQRGERARSLSDYLYAVANLAESGPDAIASARAYLRAAHYPLASAAWRWRASFGFTDVPVETMQHFVSLEEYAMRHELGSRPHRAPPFVGYAWAPQRLAPQTVAEFNAQSLALARRLAAAIRFSVAQGGGAPPGACGPPGEHVWCGGALEGAVFNAEWALLTSWDD